MAIIQRPGKEGNATTYQGKVAAGYTKILASEVDADIDTLYSAWNAGVDTVNIKDLAVTAAKLASGAVTGSALAPGSITATALAANSVTSAAIQNGTIVGADIAANTLTDSLISSVAWTKLIAPYLGTVRLTPRATVDASPGTFDLMANGPNTQSYDNTKASWLLRLDYPNDVFTLFRAPPPGTSFTVFLQVNSAGRLICNLADLSVARNQLAVNACNSTYVFQPNPSGFILSTPGFSTVATLPALTTRGGYVHLWAAAGLSVYGLGTVNGTCTVRWMCDGSPVISDMHQITAASGVVSAVPNLAWMHAPNAGTHTYAYQAGLDTANMTVVGPSALGAGFQAVEVG